MSARSNLSFSDSEIRRKAIAPLPQENASPPPPEGVMKLMQQDKKANKASDDKINQQFRYFRKEFSEAASACGIAMPLAFSEDTSGRVFSFVKHSGPEFILQMLLTETDSLHLMRTSLSLLIVTVSILRRKVPISDTNGLFSSGLFSSSFSEAMSEWAHGALRHLIDGGAVSVCINLLLSTYVQDVQELIITLIAHFVTSSNEAAFQMLQTPNSLGQMELPSYKPNKLPETPSELMDAEIPEHRREAAFVKEKLGDWVDYRKPGNSANNNSNSNIGNYVNSDLVYLEKMKRTSNNNGSASNSNNTSNGPPTCLSYLLSVCALYHNRLVVMSSCAEVIIAMTMAFEDPFFSQQVAATSTCCLPTSEDLRSSNGGNFARNSRSMRKNANSRSSTNVSSGANGSQSRPGTSTTTPSLTNQSNSRRNSLNNQKGPVRISSYGLMEWAGLKLLLKCLHRIQLCQGVSEFSDPSKSSKSDLLPGLLPTQTMTPPTTRNELELSHTHLHVLTAVMLLASRSSFVARYVIELPGAEALMKVSLDSLQAQNMVGKKLASIANDCAQALMEAHNTKQCEQYQSNNSVKSTRSMGSKRDVNANAKSMMIRRGTQINLSGNNVGFGAPLLLSTTYSDESNANTRSNYDDQMSDRDDYSDSGSPTVVTSDAQLEFESLTRKNVSKVRMNENNEAARAKLNTITDSYESDDGNVSDSSERQKRRLQLQLERQTSQRISRNASNKSKNSDYRPFQNFGRACSNEAHASTKTSEMRKEFNLKMFSSKSGDIGDDSSAGGGSSVGGGFGRMSSVCSNKSASTPGKSSVVSTSCGSSLSEVLKLDALRPIVPAPYRPSTVQGVGRQDSVNYSRYGIANHADDICSNDSAPGNLLTGSPARLEPLHSPTALTTQGFLSRKNYPTLVSPTADKQFESIANNALKKLYKKGINHYDYLLFAVCSIAVRLFCIRLRNPRKVDFTIRARYGRLLLCQR